VRTQKPPQAHGASSHARVEPPKDKRPRRQALLVAGLWSRFAGELHGWLRARIRPPELADDLLQETFVRICRGLPRLREPERLSPWVYRVTRAVLVDHLRRQHPEQPLGDSDQPAADSAESVSDADSLNELVGGWLREYLAILPPAYREAVELTEVDGITQVDLARRSGLTSSGSKSRVQRGRALLRKALLDCCDLDVDRRGNIVGYRRRPECCGPSSEP
jgi:RNA polymerase sigma-70 factor (ECF subfamily)